MNDIMQFMHELKELVHKGEEMAQQMQGGYGQRRYGRYGMRDEHEYGGGYGHEWGEHQMQGHYPPSHDGYQGHWKDVNPMMFM